MQPYLSSKPTVLVLAKPFPTVFCSLVDQYQVFVENSLNQGTWFLNDGPIDAVVVDVVGLGISTFFTLKQAYPHIPILIFARNELIFQQCRMLGAAAVIAPTATLADIQKVLESIFCQAAGAKHGS